MEDHKTSPQLLEILDYLLHEADNLIVILNKHYEFEWINSEVAESFLGFSKSELLGEDAGKIIHPDDKDYVISKLRDIKEKDDVQFSARIMHKDGSSKWIDVNGHLYETKDGIIRLFLIARNINDQKVYQQKLIESELKYRNLFNHSPLMIALINMDGKVVDYNDKIRQVGNWDDSQLNGRKVLTFLKYIPKEYHSLVSKFVKQLLRKGYLPPSEIPFVNDDNEIFWVLAQANVVIIGEKSLIQITLNDITEMKKKIQALEDKIKELEK